MLQKLFVLYVRQKLKNFFDDITIKKKRVMHDNNEEESLAFEENELST